MKEEKGRKIAVALKYDKNYNAPTVVAKGMGFIAEKILEKGKEKNVNIHKDEKLARQLIDVNIGQEIPEKFYTAVAEILAFVFELDKEKGEQIG